MSSLAQMSSITSSLDPNSQIIIITSDSDNLHAMGDLIQEECGFQITNERFKIVGYESDGLKDL